MLYIVNRYMNFSTITWGSKTQGNRENIHGEGQSNFLTITWGIITQVGMEVTFLVVRYILSVKNKGPSDCNTIKWGNITLVTIVITFLT